jgi:hypothetical protein
MLNADMVFLSRVMGAPVPAGMTAAQLPSWFGAAVSNPEKRAVGLGRIAGLLEMLPTAEDAARTPAEASRVDVGYLAQNPDGPCVCDSGLPFLDCHGRGE